MKEWINKEYYQIGTGISPVPYVRLTRSTKPGQAYPNKNE